MTLTETAVLTKRALVVLFLTMFVGILTWVGFVWYKNYQASKIPPPVEQADLKFGKLPKPKLPQTEISSTNFSYTLETETGELPSFNSLVKVYFIPQLGTTLLAPERARNLAQSLGFSNGPEVLSPTQYQFRNERGDNFIMDIDSGNFKYHKSEASDSADQKLDILPDQPKISEEFKRFLSNKGLLKDGLKDGKTKVIFEAGTQRESSSAAITLWQDDLVEGEVTYPLVTADFNKGLINGVVNKTDASTPEEELEKYQSLDYIFWPVDLTNFSTYPLKPVKTAYDDLQSGKASVLEEPSKKNVGINSVYLAYLLNKEYSPYLIPIYVFEGDNFVSYVQAIEEEYFGE